MSFDLTSIKPTGTRKAPRIVLLGVEKIGKSTFAADADNPVFLPIKGEEGVDDIDVAQFPRSDSFGDLMQRLQTLIDDDHEYKTVCIDSVTRFESLVWAKVCEAEGVDNIEKAGGGYSKGFVIALTYWGFFLDSLDKLRQKGITVILIGHVKPDRFDDPLGPSYTIFDFDIHKKAKQLILQWADSILFANSETIVKTEEVGFNKEKKTGKDLTGARFLFTQKRPGHPGGGRGVYGRLPYKLPLDWAAFTTAAADAAALTK